MWGFHDRLLTLRKALHALLINGKYTNSFYRRWKWQTSLQNREAGLILCEEEWEREWQSLLKMASTEPRVRAHSDTKGSGLNGGKKFDMLPEDEMQPHVYESLEEIHILVLAHVLKRPIIVIADTMLKDVTGEPFAPIPFGGIYLPLECSKTECHRSPLCLTYDAAHFSALVAMDKETYADKSPHPLTAIPLLDADSKLLPIQFAVDPGVDVKWNVDDCDLTLQLSFKSKLNLLREYLNVTYIPHPQCTKLAEVIDPNAVVDSKSTKALNNSDHDDSGSTSETWTIGSSSSGHASNNQTSSNGQNKNKASKQFQMITKHFGTLSRSMSKRIKKNLANLARKRASFRIKKASKLAENQDKKLKESKSKLTLNGDIDNVLPFNSIIAALIETEKRHEYHDEMIRNYLSTARIRFLKFQLEKKKIDNNKKDSSSKSESSSNTSSSLNGSGSPTWNYATQCVNSGCDSFGTAATNYLCSVCFADQKREMISKCVQIKENSKKMEASKESPADDIDITKLSLKQPNSDMMSEKMKISKTFDKSVNETLYEDEKEGLDERSPSVVFLDIT